MLYTIFTVLSHNSSVKYKKYQCDICNFGSDKRSNYTRHMATNKHNVDNKHHLLEFADKANKIEVNINNNTLFTNINHTTTDGDHTTTDGDHTTEKTNVTTSTAILEGTISYELHSNEEEANNIHLLTFFDEDWILNIAATLNNLEYE